MNEPYPNDTDGDALRRVAASGSDMTRPMEIDFHIAAPDRAAAEAIAQIAAKVGYRTKVYRHDDDNPWTCQCSKNILATYDGVVAAQDDLDDLSKPHGGHCDGWGTFGNGDQGQMQVMLSQSAASTTSTHPTTSFWATRPAATRPFR